LTAEHAGTEKEKYNQYGSLAFHGIKRRRLRLGYAQPAFNAMGQSRLTRIAVTFLSLQGLQPVSNITR
jgi:hypothetical protein